jgi:hypothetical protein
MRFDPFPKTCPEVGEMGSTRKEPKHSRTAANTHWRAVLAFGLAQLDLVRAWTAVLTSTDAGSVGVLTGAARQTRLSADGRRVSAHLTLLTSSGVGCALA